MPLPSWRDDVAALLADCAEALQRRNDRQAAAKLGTARAYLEKADLVGEAGARAMLAKLRIDDGQEQQTERFRFTTDELEEIKRRNAG